MFIQILLTIFIAFAIIKLIFRFNFWWLFFWIIAIIAVWVPDFLTKIANILGIGRGADLVLYVSVVAVFYLIFKIYVRFEKIERNITKIVRKDSLEEK